MTTGDGPAPSPTVLPQKDGTVSVLPLDGRRLAVPSRPLLFRTDGRLRTLVTNGWPVEALCLLQYVAVG